MKAAQIKQYGGPEVIEIIDIPEPTLKDGQVLVDAYAVSINPFDSKLRSGVMKNMVPLEFPATLGGDFAGIVKQVIGGVEHIKVGDKVYGQANVVGGASGAFAEVIAAKADHVAPLPSGLDFNNAASLPLAGVSAWQAITQHIDLKQNQKLFIHGGAGGIGTYALQIAKNIGAYVATTATGDGLEYVKQLGADEVIDYKNQDFSKVLSGYDAVFDTVGGDDFDKAMSILKPSSTAVTMVGPVDEAKAKELGVSAIHQGTKVTTTTLQALASLVEDGVVKPKIDKVYSFNQIVQAFKEKESGTVMGKLVLEIRK